MVGGRTPAIWPSVIDLDVHLGTGLPAQLRCIVRAPQVIDEIDFVGVPKPFKIALCTEEVRRRTVRESHVSAGDPALSSAVCSPSRRAHGVPLILRWSELGGPVSHDERSETCSI